MCGSVILPVHRRFRPNLSLSELESRQLLSNIPLVVNTLADDPSSRIPGEFTLRDAINQANALPANTSSLIKFSVQGKIDLYQSLPTLTNSIMIKGLSQITLAEDPSVYGFSVLSVSSSADVILWPM